MDNQCNLNTACPKAGLTVQQPAQYNACKKKQQAPEDVDGCKHLINNLLECSTKLTHAPQGSRRCHSVTWPSRLRRDRSLQISHGCGDALPTSLVPHC
ncbi:hypothetical protein IG631_07057 [Alternaria alternata]|nr:hypothetical protein IG631_07057 [Alternaria alternata]